MTPAEAWSGVLVFLILLGGVVVALVLVLLAVEIAKAIFRGSGRPKETKIIETKGDGR